VACFLQVSSLNSCRYPFSSPEVRWHMLQPFYSPQFHYRNHCSWWIPVMNIPSCTVQWLHRRDFRYECCRIERNVALLQTVKGCNWLYFFKLSLLMICCNEESEILWNLYKFCLLHITNSDLAYNFLARSLFYYSSASRKLSLMKLLTTFW
jgi:hypothetical protein